MKPRIANPCPMHVARLTKSDGTLSCKSCQNEIIDFRKMSDDEIKLHFVQGGCGVFYEDQLALSQPPTFWRSIAFKGLMAASFIGFSVKPMAAQNEKIIKDKNGHEVCLKAKEEKVQGHNSKVRKKKNYRMIIHNRFRRKKKTPTGTFIIGCPSF